MQKQWLIQFVGEKLKLANLNFVTDFYPACTPE